MVLIASVLGHLLTFYFFGKKPDILSRERKAKALISLYGCIKILSSLMFVHEYRTLFIKVLVLHVEFHLYFSKIRFKKKFSSTYTVHI